MSSYLATKEIGWRLSGLRTSVGNQAKAKKLDTGRNSSENSMSNRGQKRFWGGSEDDLAVGDRAARPSPRYLVIEGTLAKVSPIGVCKVLVDLIPRYLQQVKRLTDRNLSCLR